MIVHPEERVADFAKAGSDIISVHAEPAATVHLDRTVNQASIAHLCPQVHRVVMPSRLDFDCCSSTKVFRADVCCFLRELLA